MTGKAPLVLSCVSCLAMALVSAGPARADPAEGSFRFRAVVRVVSEDQHVVLARIRGQTSDLDVVLVPVISDALEPDLAAQLRMAGLLARANEARIVIWFDLEGPPEAQGPTVYVAEPGAGRVLVRTLRARQGTDAGAGPPAGDAGPGTATFELVAVVVRTALGALATGATIGIHRPELAEDGDIAVPPGAPASTAPSTTGTVESPDGEADMEWLRWIVATGWSAFFDGTSPHGRHGLEVRFGLIIGPVETALALGTTIPAERSDPYATVHLSRHTLAVSAGYRWTVAPGLCLVAGARLGVAGFYRTTADPGPDVTPFAPTLSAGFLAGPWLRLESAPAFLGGHLAVALGAGADYVPQVPVIGYEVDGVFRPFHDLWVFQPHVGLGVGVAGW